MLFKNYRERDKFSQFFTQTSMAKILPKIKYQFAHICRNQQYSIIQLTGTLTP